MGSRGRFWHAVALAPAVLAMVAAPALAQSNTVEARDFEFVPRDITVTEGESVTWQNTGDAPHTVTSDDGSSFDSGNMAPTTTFSHTFDEAGTYPYYCELHGSPGGGGMAGTVTVEAAAAEPSETPSETATPTPSETATPSESATPTPSPSETTSESPAVTGTLDADDQSGDGSSVLVRSVSIDGSTGWIVIHADADGAPGPVLGHVAVPEGPSSNVRVPLSTPLTASAPVWPMLHADLGQAGTYEFPGADVPVRSAAGAVVMEQISFTVAADAAPTLASTGSDLWIVLAAATSVAALGIALLAVRRSARHWSSRTS